MSTATPDILADRLPVPGIHRGVPEDVYHAWPLCSKHALDTLCDRSPAHLQWQRQHPHKPTPAMTFGSALHTLVLLGDPAFRREFPVADQCAGHTRGGTRCSNGGSFVLGDQWFCKTHRPEGAEPAESKLTVDDFDKLHAMRDAILSHPAAGDLLRLPGDNELSVVWDQILDVDGKPYPLRCKLRADGIRPDWSAALDIKTCEDASPDAFRKTIEKYGYHRQAAYYLDGLAAAGIVLDHFAIIAVEKEPPHAVACRAIDAESLAIGRRENAERLKKYAACDRSGVWPAYSPKFEMIGLPDWRIRQEARNEHLYQETL